MCYELDDHNNGKCLKESIEWCQNFLELGDNMDVVNHVDEVGFNLNSTS